MHAIPIVDLQEAFVYDGLTGEISKRATGEKVGYTDHDGYTIVCFKGKIIRANRLAWALTYGEWPACSVDHINRIRHDDRIENLRSITFSQNSANLEFRASNTSGFKGVCYHKRHQGYVSTICVRGRKIWLGKFSTVQEAAMAYDRAAIYFFEGFATTNYSLGVL